MRSDPLTSAAVFAGTCFERARPARGGLMLLVLAPLPWLALLIASSAAVVLAGEPLWIRDIATGQLMAASVFIALAGSGLAWRTPGFDRGEVLPRLVVASHALYLVTGALALG